MYTFRGNVSDITTNGSGTTPAQPVNTTHEKQANGIQPYPSRL